MASDIRAGDALTATPGGRHVGTWDDEHRKAALFIANRACGRHGDRFADREWAREVLEAVGLIPTVREWRISNAASARPRMQRHGRCPGCRKVKNLRVDGTVANHKTPDDRPCDGGRKAPLDAEEE